MIIEGYAAKFDDETVLYEDEEGNKYKEVIDRKAFDGVSLDDVVLNFNHGGKPVARTKNGSLKLTVDDIGLKIWADLSGSEEGRRLYEEIRNGLLDKMSFAFTVAKDEYAKDTKTRRIIGIRRLYDTAVVDFPAYENTSVQARSYFEAVAESEKLAVAEKENEQRKRQILMFKIKSILGKE